MNAETLPGVAGPPRFDPDADTLDGARRYFAHRAVQGLADGFRWSGEFESLAAAGEVWGARTWATGPDEIGRAHV